MALHNKWKMSLKKKHSKKSLIRFFTFKLKPKKRKIGILNGKANIEFVGRHNTSEEEFFGTEKY